MRVRATQQRRWILGRVQSDHSAIVTVDFGGRSSPGSAKGVIVWFVRPMDPLFRPVAAACWWARTMVEMPVRISTRGRPVVARGIRGASNSHSRSVKTDSRTGPARDLQKEPPGDIDTEAADHGL
ncbi:hypothetical protein [Streptomyces sp. DG2A-72]|uniref:hypothetical protein n=1 Tax=Streptomyces sp. DG2A-72 TaxID=3051386 RepID=UPI003464C681